MQAPLGCPSRPRSGFPQTCDYGSSSQNPRPHHSSPVPLLDTNRESSLSFPFLDNAIQSLQWAITLKIRKLAKTQSLVTDLQRAWPSAIQRLGHSLKRKAPPGCPCMWAHRGSLSTENPWQIGHPQRRRCWSSVSDVQVYQIAISWYVQARGLSNGSGKHGVISTNTRIWEHCR